jgi:hypothetical protein
MLMTLHKTDERVSKIWGFYRVRDMVKLEFRRNGGERSRGDVVGVFDQLCE